MKGFILYPTYEIIDGKPSVMLFGKLENGQSFLTINSYRPYFYIKESDKKSLPKEYDYEKSTLKNFEKKSLVKIYTSIPSEIPTLRKYLEEKGVDCYEADIKFPQRFLIDNNIKVTVDINDDYEPNELIDRVYREPTLKPAEAYSPKLKIFSIDIETSADGKKLYSLSIYSKDFERKLIVYNKKILGAENFETEEGLLEKFKDIILNEDPDILTGWNVIDFDLDFLEKKFKENRIQFNLGRDGKACKIKLESNFFRTSKCDFNGRLVLDAIDMIKGSFINLEDYKLSTAAHHFLKEKKLIGDYNKHEEIEKFYKNDPKKLLDYNLKDAKLVLDIIEKSKVLDLTIHRSNLTGMPLDRVNASIASFDSLYLRKLKEKGYAAPSSVFKNKESKIKGGYVMESKPGIYDNIIILDFKSLYPSIMRTFYIDPLAFVGKKKGKDLIIAPNKAAFKRDEALLPEIINSLMKEREKVKKQKDELTSYAIKILLNSMFGVMANPSFRFFNIDMANAITHFGQFLIKLTAEKIEEKGYEVIYSDTDSVFIKSKLDDYKEAEKLGERLTKEINIFFDEFIKNTYKTPNHLELEFEKVFKMFLMPKVRGSEAGAKKRYVGLRVVDGKEKLEFTGMESRRRDWTDLAKKFQQELLDRIFHKKEVSNFIKDFVKDLKKGKYDDLLIYRKGIRKDLKSYAVNAQHVKAALKLDRIESNIIEYYMTTDGPEPIQKQTHPIDYEYYINKQLKPIADSILLFFDKTFDGLIKGGEQSTLLNFNKNQ